MDAIVSQADTLPMDTVVNQADTLQMEPVAKSDSVVENVVEFADTSQMKPIARKDSLYRKDKVLKAYYGVRIYRSDFQAVCDSLQFNTKDSTLYLYKNPIMWNTGYQITGE
jgi:hypothetical protein